MLNVIIILLPLIFLVVDFIKERKIYSPSVIFNGIFFSTLFLYSFKWSYLQQDLSNTTLWCLFLCEIGFNIPIVISYFIKIKNSRLDYNEVITNNKSDKIIKEKNSEDDGFLLNKKLEFSIFIFVLIVFIFEVVKCKGFPLLWKFMENEEKVYVDFTVSKITIWFHALITIIGAYTLVKPMNGYLFPNLFYKGFYIGIPILIISRQMLASMIIEAFIIYLVTKRHKPKDFYFYCVIGLILGIVGFSTIGNMRTGEDMFLIVAKFKETYKYIPTAFKWIYSYMCFSISNLNNLISIAQPGITKGISTWNEIMPSMFDFDGVNIFNENFLISNNFNVSTFAPSLYLDFGIFGVGVFCLIIGIVAQFVFKNMYKIKSFAIIYSIITYALVFIFFVNMFFNFQVICQVVFTILIFVFLNNLIEKKSKKLKTKNSQGGESLWKELF